MCVHLHTYSSTRGKMNISCLTVILCVWIFCKREHFKFTYLLYLNFLHRLCSISVCETSISEISISVTWKLPLPDLNYGFPLLYRKNNTIKKIKPTLLLFSKMKEDGRGHQGDPWQWVVTRVLDKEMKQVLAQLLHQNSGGLLTELVLLLWHRLQCVP